MATPIKGIESTHSQNPVSGASKAVPAAEEISPASGLENSQLSGETLLPASGMRRAGAVRLSTSEPLNTPIVVSVLGCFREIITVPYIVIESRISSSMNIARGISIIDSTTLN